MKAIPISQLQDYLGLHYSTISWITKKVAPDNRMSKAKISYITQQEE